MKNIIDQIYELFDEVGDSHYGDEISYLDHSLYCAQLAVQDEQDHSLIAACLLHDIGHLLQLRKAPYDTTLSSLHPRLAHDFLRGHFPDSVVEPILLHVEAKRYLCTVDRHYLDRLSNAARTSLDAQGGLMDEAVCKRFHDSRWSYDAVMLRRYDDRARQKPPGELIPLEDYEPILWVLSNELHLKIA